MECGHVGRVGCGGGGGGAEHDGGGSAIHGADSTGCGDQGKLT